MSIVRGLILMLNDNDFSSINHKIAHYVLANIDTISHLSIEEVANICYTSPATFSRFCKAMNCTGFNDFKHQLSMATQDYTYTTLDILNSHHLAPNKLIDAHLDTTIEALTECKSFLTHDKVMSLMNDLEEAETVLFCGWNHLVSLNREFLFDLVMHKKVIHAAFNPSFQLGKLTSFENAMVFFIQPCKWGGTEENIKKVKNLGGKVTLISNRPSVDLSPYIDHAFTFASTHSPTDYIIIEFILSTFSAYYRKLYTKNYE